MNKDDDTTQSDEAGKPSWPVRLPPSSNEAVEPDFGSRIAHKIISLRLEELFRRGGPGHLWLQNDVLRDATREFLAHSRGVDLEHQKDQRALIDYYARISLELDTSIPMTEELRNSVNALYLSGTDLNDKGAVYLASFRNLTTLHVDETKIESLEAISSLECLEELDITDTSISDISPLKRLSNLQDLSLAGVLAEDYSCLAGLTALSHLDLSRTGISHLGPLRQLHSMCQLDLRRTSIDSIAPIGGLTQLWSLDISYTKVRDLSPLAGFSDLRSLSLCGTKVVDISPLAQLSSLKDLDLTATQISDLSPLENLAPLAIVRLPDGRSWLKNT